MRLTLVAAALAAAMSTAVPALAGGEWPDSPNKPWFEKLQRPDYAPDGQAYLFAR